MAIFYSLLGQVSDGKNHDMAVRHATATHQALNLAAAVKPFLEFAAQPRTGECAVIHLSPKGCPTFRGTPRLAVCCHFCQRRHSGRRRLLRPGRHPLCPRRLRLWGQLLRFLLNLCQLWARGILPLLGHRARRPGGCRLPWA